MSLIIKTAEHYTDEDTKHNRKVWIEALRSGEYKQTDGCLTENGRFCCLGVYSELASKVVPEIKQISSDSTIYYDNEVFQLSRNLANSLGMTTNEGVFGNTDTIHRDDENPSLVWLNDDRNMNFEDIATVIESEPNGLFL